MVTTRAAKLVCQYGVPLGQYTTDGNNLPLTWEGVSPAATSITCFFLKLSSSCQVVFDLICSLFLFQDV